MSSTLHSRPAAAAAAAAASSSPLRAVESSSGAPAKGGGILPSHRRTGRTRRFRNALSLINKTTLLQGSLLGNVFLILVVIGQWFSSGGNTVGDHVHCPERSVVELPESSSSSTTAAPENQDQPPEEETPPPAAAQLEPAKHQDNNVDNEFECHALTWSGGNPPTRHDDGSCVCSRDAGRDVPFCLCTPSLAIDLIVGTFGADGHDVWLVQRSDTKQLAVMGGFVEVGETLEQAIQREMLEEMNVDIEALNKEAHRHVRHIGFPGEHHQPLHPIPVKPLLLGAYSDPRRDNRRHTVSVVYYIELPPNTVTPVAGSDAEAVQRISLDTLERHEFFADHKTILMDYRERVQELRPSDTGEPFRRSLCHG